VLGNSLTKYDRSMDGLFPLYASRGAGAYVWDVDGNRYIDYVLGYGTVILGHADADVNRAAAAELSSGVNLSPLWRPKQVELAEMLTSIVPGAELAFMMRTGSDATTGALRLARVFTGRQKVVRWGYNGWHDWCAGSSEGIPDSTRDDTLTFDYNDPVGVRSLFDKEPDRIACVLMMPFELEAPQADFLHVVRRIAHDHGALFILDDMRAGFRMALGGSQEYFGVQADLATFSKALANGYPISAITGRADIMRCMRRTQMVSTYFANSAEMAAAVATITKLRDSDAIAHVWRIGEQLQDGLRALSREFDVPMEVLGYPPCPWLRFSAADDVVRSATKVAFYKEVTARGVLFHPDHHWFVSASHTSDDIADTLEACRHGLRAAMDSLDRIRTGQCA